MSYANLLLVDRSVPDYQVFLDSVNESTCAVLYSPTTTSDELNEMIHEKTNAVERIGFVFRKQDLLFEKPFLESKDYLVSLISELNTKNIDFLACNTLNDPLWKEMYEQLEKTGVVVGASSDLTGNLKYGGNWVMESTSQDIEHIYFTNTIEYYKYLLDFGYKTFFVKEDGLYGIGDNTYGQLGIETYNSLTSLFKKVTITQGLTVTKVASGENHTMVLLSNNDLYGIGDNTYGQLGDGTNITKTVFTLVESGVTEVSCGGNHTMIIKGTSLYGTGLNDNGQLGDGTNADKNTFVISNTGDGATQVSCGYTHTMIIKWNSTTETNELYGTGRNNYGQLGDGTTIDKNTFVISNTGNGATQVSCGGNHTMIIKGTSLYGTGFNLYGQLGDGTNADKNTFVISNTGNGVTKVSCGNIHTMILKGTNLYGTGYNLYGQLGDGTNADKNTFPATEVATGVTKLSCGSSHTMVLKDTNLYGTGRNNYGQLGDGTTIDKNTFPVTAVATEATQLLCGYFKSYIFKETNLYGAGINTNGQLGVPYFPSCYTAKKIVFARYMDIKSISNGTYHTMLLLNNNELWGTGINDKGQLGDGTTINKTVFTLVESGVTEVSCGYNHTMIIKGTSLYGTGLNNRGQLGDGTTTARNTFVISNTGDGATKVSCGHEYTMILKDTNLYGTGFNLYGQLGDGTFTDKMAFPSTALATGVTQVSCSIYHTMILLKNGELWGTGYNYYGHLGDGTNTDTKVFKLIDKGVSQVSCGANHTLLIKNNTLYGTGLNAFGQLGNGTTTTYYEFIPLQTGVIVTQVTCINSHTIINKWNPSTQENQLYGTGYNNYGQLGDGTDGTNYEFILIASNIIKVKPYISISVPLTSKTVTLSTTTNSAGSLSYETNNNTLATITNNTLSIYKGSKINIIIKQSSTDKYQEGFANFTIDTNDLFTTPTVDKFIINLDSKTYSIPAPLTNSSGVVTYTSSNTAVATISSNPDQINIISSGLTTITRLIASDGTYKYYSEDYIIDTRILYPGYQYNTTVTLGTSLVLPPLTDASDNKYNTFQGDDTRVLYGSLVSAGTTLGRIDLGTNTFVFGGAEQTTIYIGINGTITFGTSYGNVGNLNSVPSISGIYPFAADLDTSRVAANSKYIKYRVINDTVEVFYNSQIYRDGTNPSKIEIKVTLYLKNSGADSGKVVIQYGNMVYLPAPTTEESTFYSCISFGAKNANGIFTTENIFLNSITNIPYYPIFKKYKTQTNDISNRTITIVPLKNPKLRNFTIPNQTVRSFNITAPSSDSSGTFTYVSSDPDVVDISNNQITVKNNNKSSVTITATQAANEIYSTSSITSLLYTGPYFVVDTTLSFSPIVIDSRIIPLYASSSRENDPTPITYSIHEHNCNTPPTISGNELTINSPGNITIKASQIQNNLYNAGVQYYEITLSQTTEVINPGLGSLTFPTTERTFNITDPSSNSLGAFTYVSSHPDVVDISNNQITVKNTNQSSVTITATQAANGLFVAGSTFATLITGDYFKNPGLGSLTFPTTDRTFDITDPSSNSLGAFTYVSSRPDVVEVDNVNKKITVKNNNESSVTITATQAANGLFVAGSTFATLITGDYFKNPGLGSLTFPTTDRTFDITDPSSNSLGAFTYVSSRPDVVEVDNVNKKITVKNNNESSVTITATQAANGLFVAGSTVATLNTGEYFVETILNNEPIIITSRIIPLSVSSNRVNDLTPITYSIHEHTCNTPPTISGDQLTINSPGDITIKASQAPNKIYNAGEIVYPILEEDTIGVLLNFTVHIPPTPTVRIFPLVATSNRVGSAKRYAITYEIMGGIEKKSFIYKKALVIKDKGDIIIKATQKASTGYAKVETFYTIFGSETAKLFKTSDIIFPDITQTIPTSRVITLAATSTRDDTTPVVSIKYTIKTDSGTIKSILSGNKLTVRSNNAITITAKQAASGLYDAAEGEYTIPLSYIEKLFPETSLLPGETFKIDIPEDKTIPIPIFAPKTNSPGVFTYKSSKPSVASISGNTIIVRKKGSTVITATQKNNGLYKANKFTCPLNTVDYFP